MKETLRFARVRPRNSLIAALCCALAFTATPAGAEHFENVREVSAEDGVAAAAAWSKLAFPDAADSVLLGRADLFADSLASGSLQGDQPLLLTNSQSLSQPAIDEIDRLKARSVTILGGTSAISASVEQDLRDRGYNTRRLSGASRIETAVAVARAGKGHRTALVARAFGTSDPTAAFADALSAGAWAAETAWPVLLTETDRLSLPTAAYMQDSIDDAYVIGGAAAVSDVTVAQMQALGVTVKRVSGASRFDTAIAIAKERGYPTAAQATEVVLVDGQGANAWTDGFAAAAYAGRNKAPIVLANSAGNALPEPTVAYLQGATGVKLLTGWTVPESQVEQAATTMGQATGVTRVMEIRLSGKNVVREDDDPNEPLWGHGDEDATGVLTLTLDEVKDTIAFTYQSDLDSEPSRNSALVLRRGRIDQRGPVVALFPSPDEDHRGSGEVTAEDFVEGFSVAQLIATPEAFYAEVSTRSHDEGALRGQLPAGGEGHLPIKPELQRIESKANDDWITLHFTAPVFGPNLEGSDFTVKVGDSLSATVRSVDVARAAHEARNTAVLKLNRPAVNAKTTSVQLEESGADELMNNLGENPEAVTRTEVTQPDTVPPVFETVDAVAGATTVSAVFSEPVHTADADIASHVSVGGTSNGQSFTATVSGPVKVAKDNRSTRLPITISTAIPANAEVRVTFTSAGAGNIKDGANVPMSATGVLTRAATVRAESNRLEELTATDLVAGAGRFDPSRNQDLVITGRVVGDLAGKPISLVMPADDPTTFTGISLARARAELTWGSQVLLDDNMADLKFDVPAGTTVPDGTRFTLAIRDVAVTRAASATPLDVPLSRGDAPGVRFDMKVKVLNGVEVLSYGSLPTGLTAAKQRIQFKIRGSNLAVNSIVNMDLSRLIAAGVDYSTATIVGPAVAGTGAGTARWVGNPRSAVQYVATTATTVGAVVTLTLEGVKTPSGESYNVPVTFTRSDANMATLQQLYHVLSKTLREPSSGVAAPVTNAWTWPAETTLPAPGTPLPAASLTTLGVTFAAHGQLPAGEKVRMDFRHSLLPKPENVQPSTEATTEGWQLPTAKAVVYSGAGNAGLAHGASSTVQITADNRLVGKTVLLEVSRSDQPRMRWTIPIALTPLGDVPLAYVSGDSMWANAGNRIDLWFHGPLNAPVAPATALTGSIKVRDVQTRQTVTIECGPSVTCSPLTSVDPNRRGVRMTLVAAAPIPIASLQTSYVDDAAFAAMVSSTTYAHVDAPAAAIKPTFLNNVSDVNGKAAPMPPP